jgi:type I restriction enzyme R subunit
VAEGIRRHLRHQRPDEIPQLYAYAHLLLALGPDGGRYGTTHTPAKFWAHWREEEFSDAQVSAVKDRPLPLAAHAGLLAHRPQAVRAHFDAVWSRPAPPTDLDRLLMGLLAPARLLELLRGFVLFDRRAGKIVARYQQFYGTRALVERLRQVRRDGGREGGVLWHSAGSGKTLTMVFLTRALLLREGLQDCRVVVVSDRVDLEDQLARNFISSGAFGSAAAARREGERSKVTTGRELARRIGQGSERILFTLVHKFNTASRLPECRNDSPNLLVLVDEGHRSHGGELHARMRRALPNAGYVAFTGTPLLKDEKAAGRFGPIVHAYTMQRAVEDEAVTPLLYEERVPGLALDDEAVSRWFDTITAGLSEPEKSRLKRKCAGRRAIHGAAGRIELIAWDIATHFHHHLKLPGLGLKGQLATDSKLDAIRYKRALDATGLVSSAIVISAPDTREGNPEVTEASLHEVQEWWRQNVGGAAESYERDVLARFAGGGDPDLLIVVDRLLTGFDEPRNAVLYLDKPLRGHNLIQAVARVNRLHDAKRYGLLVDYRGILRELDTAMRAYRDLEQRTQGGFEPADLEDLYRPLSSEYERLPALHDRLWSFFPGLAKERDVERFRRVLSPKIEIGPDGGGFDARRKLRDDFCDALTAFGLCLQTALASRGFQEDRAFGERLIARYKRDLHWFSTVRQRARQDAMDTGDRGVHEAQIRRLVDQQVIGREVREPEGVYVVHALGAAQDPAGWSEDKTRNEASLIRTRLRRTIEQDLAGDPYAQKVFAELLREAIAEAESMFDHPQRQYALLSGFERRLQARETPGVPRTLHHNPHATAYYGAMRLVLGDRHFSEATERQIEAWAAEALAIDDAVRRAIAENSLNLQGIEAAIRKALLPRLYALMGLDAARAVIDHVVRMTKLRLGWEP